MKAWKMFEKEVATHYGGLRRVRVSYEIAGDIIHPVYSIECKWGKQIPLKALRGEKCKFLDNAFQQAKSYDPKKIPMVCLKRPRQRGFVALTLSKYISNQITRAFPL